MLNNTLYFFKKHFVVISGLGLIAALGRAFQLGGFGHLTQGTHVVLEVVIESARILIFLFVLGLANTKKGVLRIRRLFTDKQNRKVLWAIAIDRFKMQWFLVFRNIIGFILIAGVINYLIDVLVYETCLYLSLKQNGLLVTDASEWPLLLFLKNLTVIPFTLIFDALLILWLSNKINNYRKSFIA